MKKQLDEPKITDYELRYYVGSSRAPIFGKEPFLIEARRNEVMTATWEQFDLEKGIWCKSSYMTQQEKKAEYLYLFDKAMEVLNQL